MQGYKQHRLPAPNQLSMLVQRGLPEQGTLGAKEMKTDQCLSWFLRGEKELAKWGMFDGDRKGIPGRDKGDI